MTGQPGLSGQDDLLTRHWVKLVVLLWLLVSAWFLIAAQPQIHWFALGDTDDNMRMMQVRALLKGQDWYDLRQYRLDSPGGANMHWSHLVDLPIAGIILALRPFLGGAMAEKVAVSVAPLIPLLVALFGLGLTTRRLVAPGAAILAGIMFVLSVTVMGMFKPLRIDHHGWQLAMLTWLLAGLADEKQMRGGLTVGIASAVSLVIGLEALPWLAIAGAGVALRWIMSVDQAARLRGYALGLGAGVALGFLGFASNDNWVTRCDALTPVWVSVLLLAAAGLLALSFVRVQSLIVRLVLSGVLGAALLAFLVLAWPDCLGRPEQVSPELERLWLTNINEAKPIYTRNWPTIVSSSVLLIGLFGSFWALWRYRGEALGAAWGTIALLSLGSGLMTLWQVRAAPSALTLSVPGAALLGWLVLPRLRNSGSVLVRTFGVVAAFLAVSGVGMQMLAGALPATETVSPAQKRVNKANARCPTIPSLRPIALMPKATILTFVDLGPRLITMTHHDALAGPYHRNGDAILDVHKAFRGSAEDARDVMKRHGATMLLICPDMSESTIYKAENPKGFYGQLVAGKVPAWLEPVALPERSPFQLWRLRAGQ